MNSPFLTLVFPFFFGFFALIDAIPPPLVPSTPPPPPAGPYSPPPGPYSPPPPVRKSPPPPGPPVWLSRAFTPSPPWISSPPPPAEPRKYLHPPSPEIDGHHQYHYKKEELNTGQIIGLMFIGVSAVLQVCVVAFLLIRRRQLLKFEHGF